MLSPGSRLATYEVRERLAVGGMGEVYLCRHRLLDRIDAVKILRPHLVADQAFRRRFLREALSAARLRHPNIVTVYTADEVDGQLYLAMEYIPGVDLAAILDHDEVLEPSRAVTLLEQVADALDAAHRVQMTHRDVKPSNVLVEYPGQGAKEHAYLVDFGLSKSAQALDQDITITGQVLGTVAYIAPEQLQNAVTDGRCDQYSLACMAFECLTGHLPYERDNQIAVITAHLTAPVPTATALRSDLPAALDEVLIRGMAKTPEERYDSCGEFVAALRGAIAPRRRSRGAGPAGQPAAGAAAEWADPDTPAAVHLGPLERPAAGREAVVEDVPVDAPPEVSLPAAADDTTLPGTGRRPVNALRRDEAPPTPSEPVNPAAPPGFTIPADTPFGMPQHFELPPERRTDTPVSPGPGSTGSPGPDPARHRPSGPPQNRSGRTASGSYPVSPSAWAGGPTGSGPNGAGEARLYLAVVGGPDAGRLVPLPEGTQQLGVGRSSVNFTVSGWSVTIAGNGGASVNGEPLFGARPVKPGDLLTAGPALMEVRSARHLVRLAPNAPPPDPVTVDRVARDRLAAAIRGPQHPQTLVSRIGWLARRPPVPIAIPLANAGGIALRGSAAATAPLARWLLAQAAVLHDARDLCLAAALSPLEDERWAWLPNLPHARPGTRPLDGPHLATTREGALDLTARLRALVDVRRAAAADAPNRGLITLPRVVAVLDDRLGGIDTEYVTAAGGPVGVHVVRLIDAGARPPAGCRVCLDLDPSGGAMTVWVAGRPGAQAGVPDGVGPQYVRMIADVLGG